MKEKPRTPPGHDRVSSPIPAPDDLEIVQAFLNTVTFGTKKKADELKTPRSLADWLSRQGLLPAGTQLTGEDLRRAREVRRGLRALLLANNGYELDEEAVARLDQASMGARAQIRFERDGTSRLETVSRDFDDALGTLLAAIHVAQSQGVWPRLKVCARAQCRGVFYDFSKGQIGRWCTKRCGDRIRAQAARRSRRQADR